MLLPGRRTVAYTGLLAAVFIVALAASWTPLGTRIVLNAPWSTRAFRSMFAAMFCDETTTSAAAPAVTALFLTPFV